MSGLAAAITGFVGGYAKGKQIKSDLEDAESRRGLQNLQKQSAELTIEREKQMADLSKQIGDKVMNFKPAALDDVDSFDTHYNEMEGLLVKQAAIAGKDPLAVKTQMDGLRREKYAERVFAASKMFETGNEAGFEILKPVYNRLFKDGNTLMGGVYNKVDDTFDIRYMGKGGEEKTVTVGREALVKQYLPMGLNTGDALKLALKELEVDEERKFQTGRDTAKMEFQAGEGAKDRASAEKRTGMQIAGEKAVAGIRRSNAGDDRQIERDEKNEDDVRKGLAAAFGFDSKFSTPDKLAEFNTKATAGMNIWRATKKYADQSLSEYDVATIVSGIQSGKARVAPAPGLKGFNVVDFGGARAVVPEGIVRLK